MNAVNRQPVKRPPNIAGAVVSETQQIEAATYIYDVLLELRGIAKSARLRTLMGLIELANYEAFSKAHKTEVPQAERELLKEMEKIAANL
jgi:hypothetical protein